MEEMFPFGNTAGVVEVTGVQLKEIFERGVYSYPEAVGPFLTVSKEVVYELDPSKQGQELNAEETEIATSGERITSLKIDGEEIAFNNFVGKIFSDVNLAVIKNLKGIDLNNIDEIQFITQAISLDINGVPSTSIRKK